MPMDMHRLHRARLSDQQVEDLLSRVVQLFTFISDKVRGGCCAANDQPWQLTVACACCVAPFEQDMFALHYRNQLSKRLLNQRSASGDAERSMISKLKLRCGAQFTGKMEGMLADLQVGTDHNRCVERLSVLWHTRGECGRAGDGMLPCSAGLQEVCGVPAGTPGHGRAV